MQICKDGQLSEIFTTVKLRDVLKDKYRTYTICSGKNGTYINHFSTFDIETTNMDKYGFMYVAMLCVGEDVFFFRRWEEVVEAFNILVSFYKVTYKKRYVVYVHFLSYEFQFMRAFFEWKDIFAVKERIVLKAVTESGIEFRCSYKLSNMSLEKFLINTPEVLHFKQSGLDYNYKKIRTCSTELSSIEVEYAQNDVLGLHEALEYLLKEDTLESIPLTSTGYVRRDTRNAFLSNPFNRKIIQDGKIDAYIYLLLRTMRRGGDTACNIMYSNEELDYIVSYDKKSSYPYEMLTKKYPVGKWIPDSGKNIDMDSRAYILVIELNNIILKDSNMIGYIPVAKTVSKANWINANGRIVKADYVKVIVTELDFDIIKSRYNIESCDIIEAYSCRKEYLPLEIRQVIFNYFMTKEDTDKIENFFMYTKSKNKLNAIFGMMLTDITHSEYKLSGDEWIKEDGDVEKMLNDYFESRNSFLLYQWGVWVTSYARYSLDEPYRICYKDMIYCDTDSWKCFKTKLVEDTINKINSRIESEIDKYDVKPAYRGNILGRWELEEVYRKFKTLGSKKYAVIHRDDSIEVTVSGLSKEYGSMYFEILNSGLESFTDEVEIPEKWSGRTVSSYDDNSEIRQITVNGDTFTTASSVSIHDTTYTLDRTAEYSYLTKFIKEYGIENIN